MKKERLSTLGLLLITVWAAMQYIFLQNIPDTVSTFCTLCITNLVGLAILGVTQLRKLKKIQKATLIKGSILAIELCCFNFFLLLAYRRAFYFVRSIFSLGFTTNVTFLKQSIINLFNTS